jgi:hypothetical protein
VGAIGIDSAPRPRSLFSRHPEAASGMEFERHRKSTHQGSDLDGTLRGAGVLLKVVLFIVLLSVGLKLTFWAVDIVDELLHRPAEIAILQPLLATGGEGAERLLTIEDSENGGVTIRDRNALSTVFLFLMLAILFGAIGRAIAALIGGAIRLVSTIEFGSKRPERKD